MAPPAGPGSGDGGREGMPLDVRHRGDSGRARGPGGWLTEGRAGFAGMAFNVGLPTIDRPPSATDFNMDGTLAGREVASHLVSETAGWRSRSMSATRRSWSRVDAGSG